MTLLYIYEYITCGLLIFIYFVEIHYIFTITVAILAQEQKDNNSPWFYAFSTFVPLLEQWREKAKKKYLWHTVLGEFRSLTLRVSREMINNALKYITKNTDGRNVEFDATEFFLNHVSLRQRTDGIAALLCIAIYVRVEFN